jgi:hypothetical protein
MAMGPFFRSRRVFAAPLAFAAAISLFATQAAAQSPEVFIREVGQAFQRLADIAPGDTGGLATACAHIVANAIDSTAVASQVAADLDPKPNAGQQTRLAAAVRARLARECRGIRNDIGDDSLAILGTRRSGPLWVVTTRGSGRTIVWRLRAGGPWGMTAMDISVDGRGVVTTLLGDAAQASLSRGGDVDAAIAAITR